jgi:hypothetical protein
MKNFVIAAVLALSGTQAFASDVVVCEGKIANQYVSFYAAGNVVGIIKGRVDLNVGGLFNNQPFEEFSEADYRYEEGENGCTLTAESEQGRFTVEAPCTGRGVGKIENLNIQSLGLVSASMSVACRHENYRTN